MKLVDDDPCPCGSGKLYSECHKAMLRTKIPSVGLSHIPLSVIPEPDPNTRTVFEHTDTKTLFFFDPTGRYSLDCGSCGATLLVVSDRQQVSNIVLRCRSCGEFNDT